MRQPVDGVDVRCRGMREAPELFHRAEQRTELWCAARLHVLEHRGLVAADPLRSGDAPLEWHAKLDTELFGHRLRLGHHGGRELARGLELTNVDERRARERTDRVESEVAPQLQPDLGADVREHRALEAGAREAFRDALRTRTRGAIELADGKAIALDVLHDPG